jgi:hypothetical protein
MTRVAAGLAVTGALVGAGAGGGAGYFWGYSVGLKMVGVLLGVLMFAGGPVVFRTKCHGIGKWCALGSALCGLGSFLCFSSPWLGDSLARPLGGLCGAVLFGVIGAELGFLGPLIILAD